MRVSDENLKGEWSPQGSEMKPIPGEANREDGDDTLFNAVDATATESELGVEAGVDLYNTENTSSIDCGNDDSCQVGDYEKTSYDIGDYIGEKITNFVKKNLLVNPWTPPKHYDFPYSEHRKQNKVEKRYAQAKVLKTHEWLDFSHTKRGYFCKYCPFFVNAAVGGSAKHVPLKKFVTQPLQQFSKLTGKTGDLHQHSMSLYDLNAVIAAKHFLASLNEPKVSVVNQISLHRLQQVIENRKRLIAIVKNVVFLGRQNISFRGHRDYGPLQLGEKTNEGNFRELLKFRVSCGDEVLQNHLRNASARATYISSRTQNELINCCGDEITSTIISRVRIAKMYSVIFDESTDMSQISQLTIILRYLFEGKMYEDFVRFVDLFNELRESASDAEEQAYLEQKITGISLGSFVIKTLRILGLLPEGCVAITADGCSVNVSETCGAVLTVQNECKNAVYSPCHSHMLNLSISKSSSVQSIRNAVGTMKEIISFFHALAKRSSHLKTIMGRSLTGLCETRWNERHEGVQQFRESLPVIIETLNHISSWKDPSTSLRARTLKFSLCNCDFIVSLICLSDVLNCTLPLSRLFQKVNIDVKYARDMLNDTSKILMTKRESCDDIFSSLYDEICEVADELDVVIRIPRIVGRQNNRENYPAETAEDYFRMSVYIPLLENVSNDLNVRFSKSTLDLLHFSRLLPTSASWTNQQEMNESILRLSEKYCELLNLEYDIMRRSLLSEMDIWRVKWQRIGHDSSHSAIDFLQICDKDIFPIIHSLLSIFVTIPISSASAERSFSTLKRLKTWLRATMNGDRLVGLALLHIHHNIDLDLDKVVDRYAQMRKHRDEFVL